MRRLQTFLVFALLTGFCHAQDSPSRGSFGVLLGFLEDSAKPGQVQFWAVMAVAPGSPAYRAGIQAGDKIIYVDGQIADKASWATLRDKDSADFLVFRSSNGAIFKVTGLRKAADVSYGPQWDQETQQKSIDAYVASERQNIVAASAQPLPQYTAPPEAVQTSEPAPAKKPGFWSNLVTAMANQPGAAGGGFGGGGGSTRIAGTWQGGKSEHDYLHGGYVNADWSFTFGADGSYDETVFVGGQQDMHAAGSYSFPAASKPGDRTVTNMLTFNPTTCDYTSRELAQVVAPFPVPTNAPVQEYVNFFSLSDGNTMMLQNAARSGSESWQMKAR